MSKLVIECDKEGRVFVYHEDEKHHKAVEKVRQRQLQKLDWDDIAEDCWVEPGQYMVVPIVSK